ncbi:MAG: hypothetical protein AAF380_01335 [Bacteroidota bacterium]
MPIIKKTFYFLLLSSIASFPTPYSHAKEKAIQKQATESKKQSTPQNKSSWEKIGLCFVPTIISCLIHVALDYIDNNYFTPSEITLITRWYLLPLLLPVSLTYFIFAHNIKVTFKEKCKALTLVTASQILTYTLTIFSVLQLWASGILDLTLKNDLRQIGVLFILSILIVPPITYQTLIKHPKIK